MDSNNFWSRLREARAVQGLLVFLGASWLILQLLDIFIDNLGVPPWTMVGAVIILGIGLVIQLSVVWVQALHLTRRNANREEEDGPSDSQAEPFKEPPREIPNFTWARFALGGIFAFALLFGISGVYVLFVQVAEGSSPEPVATSAPSAAPGVAVLPFMVSGAQLDQIGDGMANLLSTNIDGAGGLRSIDNRTVLARWDELVQGQGRPDQPTNLAVARAAGAEYALLGSAVAVGSDVRLQVDIYDVASGDLLDRRQVEGRPDSVLSLVDRLSVDAIDVILGRTLEENRVGNLRNLMTASIPALKEFLDGEAEYRSSDFEAARTHFEQAIVHDSTFALAYYQLSNTWGWTNGPGHPGAVENRGRAVELGDRLPERQSLLVRATDQLFLGELGTIDMLEDAVARYPDHAEAWYLLGDAYFHLGARSLASPRQMDDAFAQAVALDPKFAPFHIHLLDLSFPLGDSALASRRIQNYRDLAEGSLFDRRSRLQFDLAYGDPGTRRIAQIQLEATPVEDLRPAASAYLNACCWHAKEPVLRELRQRGDEDTQAFAVGQLASGAMSHGEIRKALDLYEDPAINPGARVCTLSFYSAFGYPLPDDLLDPMPSLDDMERKETMEPLCRALYAGSKGRWAAFDDVVAYYEGLQPKTEGESAYDHDHDPQVMARSLRGYKLWQRGQPEAALPLIEEAFREGLFGWWLGEVYEELGRYQEAARFYAAQYLFPPAYYRLGRVYEQLGEPEKGRRRLRNVRERVGERGSRARVLGARSRRGDPADFRSAGHRSGPRSAESRPGSRSGRRDAQARGASNGSSGANAMPGEESTARPRTPRSRACRADRRGTCAARWFPDV